MCTLGSVITLDHGVCDIQDKDFWGYLGGEGEIGPAVPDDAEMEEFTPILFQVDGDPTKALDQVGTGTPLKKGQHEACLQKAALDDSNVYLVDAGWEIFIWIGSGAETTEKVAAMGAADRYAEMEPRAKYLPVTIVKSGKECDEFLSYFD
jgi:gelsolin